MAPMEAGVALSLFFRLVVVWRGTGMSLAQLALSGGGSAVGPQAGACPITRRMIEEPVLVRIAGRAVFSKWR